MLLFRFSDCIIALGKMFDPIWVCPTASPVEGLLSHVRFVYVVHESCSFSFHSYQFESFVRSLVCFVSLLFQFFGLSCFVFRLPVSATFPYRVVHRIGVKNKNTLPRGAGGRGASPTLSSWGLGPRGHAVVLPRQRMDRLAQLVSPLTPSWGRLLGGSSSRRIQSL